MGRDGSNNKTTIAKREQKLDKKVSSAATERAFKQANNRAQQKVVTRKETTVVHRAPEAKGSRKPVQYAKALEPKRRAAMRDALAAWLAYLARPFTAPRATCPVNYNPVPTFVTSYATTKALRNISVTGSSTVEVTIFGSHGEPDRTKAMDGVSYHGTTQEVNIGVAASTRIVGPIAVQTAGPIYQPLVAAVTSGLSTNQAAVTTATVNCAAVEPDNLLPYTGNSTQGGGHTRWKLVSCGARIINRTPKLSRGGIIRTVQPSSAYASAQQTDFDRFQTFSEHDGDTEGLPGSMLEVSWIPRPTDLAYWHCNDVASDDSTADAIMRIWLTAPPSNDQQFEVQLIHNWELAGSNLATIGSPTIHVPSDKNIVEPTLDYLSNSQTSSRSALEVAKSVAGEIYGFVDGVARVAGKAAPVVEAMSGIIKMMA